MLYRFYILLMVLIITISCNESENAGIGEPQANKDVEDSIATAKQKFEQASADYISAKNDISRLKELLRSAQQGLIDKHAVVEKYNYSIGRTMGEVKTFSEVRERLNSIRPGDLARLRVSKEQLNEEREHQFDGLLRGDTSRKRK